MHAIDLPRWPGCAPRKPWAEIEAGLELAELPHLQPGDGVNDLEGELSSSPVVVLTFTHFADGRPFSQARRLRSQLHYQGVIVATGNILPDQVPFLARCGVDVALLGTPEDVDVAAQGLKRFDGYYQPTGDGRPILRGIGGA